jgi:hypothetical protein
VEHIIDYKYKHNKIIIQILIYNIHDYILVTKTILSY